MKHIRWIPLTFLAGVHGFAIFAPYVAVMLAVAHLAQRKHRRPVPVAILQPVGR